MDDVCTLVKETTVYDELGVPTSKQTHREVFCQVFGITRSEFYAAAAADLNPEITVRLTDFMDYEGEQLVEYHGEMYSVIRVYRSPASGLSGMSANAVELILERKAGTKGATG